MALIYNVEVVLCGCQYLWLQQILKGSLVIFWRLYRFSSHQNRRVLLLPFTVSSIDSIGSLFYQKNLPEDTDDLPILAL